jgi:hypothetical protein
MIFSLDAILRVVDLPACVELAERIIAQRCRHRDFAARRRVRVRDQAGCGVTVEWSIRPAINLRPNLALAAPPIAGGFVSCLNAHETFHGWVYSNA